MMSLPTYLKHFFATIIERYVACDQSMTFGTHFVYIHPKYSITLLPS